MYTILITGPDLIPVGDPVGRWTSLDITRNFNAAGSGEFTAPADPDLMALVTTPGNRVNAIRNNRIELSGPIEKPGALARSVTDDNSADPGQVTVTWASNEALMGWRCVYPDPAHTPDAQTADSYVSTGNAEAAMRNLVNLNAGPGALADRQINKLILGDLTGVGGDLPAPDLSRFEVLADVLRRLAAAGGGIGWRVAETAARELEFQVYAPVDRSARVRFSWDLGNLRTLQTDPAGPTCNAALVGGSGDGASRYVLERLDTTSIAGWGRIEKWISQGDSEDFDTVIAAGDEALAEGAESVTLTTSIVDTTDAAYGIHYDLGDKVTVELLSGFSVVDIVRSVQIKATPDGEVITPVVGTGSASRDSALLHTLRAMEQRLSKLERR